jgi:hypothetical protein
MDKRLQQGIAAMKRGALSALLVAFSCATISQAAHGYGAEAHAVVGHVAEQYICPATREWLSELMPGESLAEAGTWADQIRSDPDWDVARPWHYINVPDGVALSAANRRQAGDVLQALERFRLELGDSSLSRQQRLEAVYFVVHLVADLHQPLHVGRREDLGGNKVDIRVNGRKTSLHYYWDTGVLDGMLGSPAEFGMLLAARNKSYASRWQATGPRSWAVESQAFRPEVYDFDQIDDQGTAELSPAYQARAQQITRFRLAMAGIRLAGVLNDVGCPAPAGAGDTE